MKTLQDQIRELIKNDEVGLALDLLMHSANKDRATLLYSRWQKLKQRQLNFTIREDDANLELNKIKENILIISSQKNSTEITFGKKDLELLEEAEMYYFNFYYGDAYQAYKKLLTLGIKNDTVILRFCNCLISIKAYGEALLACQKYLGEVQDDSKLYNFMGYIHDCLGNDKQAKTYFELALSKNPKQPLFFNNLLVSLRKEGLDQEQINLCTHYISRFPDHAFFYYKRSEIYFEKFKNYGRAKEDIQMAIALQSEKAEYYYLRSKIYSYGGNYEKAISDISFAYTLAPQLDYLKMKAAYHHDAKKYHQAILVYTDIVAREIKADFQFYARADCYFNLGDFSNALNDVRTAISLNNQDKSYFELEQRILSQLNMPRSSSSTH